MPNSSQDPNVTKDHLISFESITMWKMMVTKRKLQKKEKYSLKSKCGTIGSTCPKGGNPSIKQAQAGPEFQVGLLVDQADGSHNLQAYIASKAWLVCADMIFRLVLVTSAKDMKLWLVFAVHEKYPVDRPRVAKAPLSLEDVKAALTAAKEKTPLKKILNPLLDCGGGVLDHELLQVGIPIGAKFGHYLKVDDDLTQLHAAAVKAQAVVTEWVKRSNKEGYIIKKIEERKKADGSTEEVPIYQDFMPFLFSQYAHSPFERLPTFNQACDEYFSKMEAGKIDHRALQKEKEALRKLENVKRDHERRLQELSSSQKTSELQGHIIELNKDLVEAAILVVRSAVANQIDWRQIQELLAEAQARGDPVALAIRQLKLESNVITLLLSDPYDCDEDDLLLDSDEEREEGNDSTKMRPMTLDIDLELSAMANARRYFEQKRQAAKKEQKTISASAKVLQLTTKKTNQMLKEVAAITNINKARKVLWFEKFHWFISTENYLVIAGRDSQMNEMLVKRHLHPRDIYVHADMHGAASVVIKNPSGKEPPPKTLHEAGIMALCYRHADERKIRSIDDDIKDSLSSLSMVDTNDHIELSMVEEEDEQVEEEVEKKEAEDSNIVDTSQDIKSNPITEDPFSGEYKQESGKEMDAVEDGTNDEDEKAVEYPDTLVEMHHVSGDQFFLRPRTVSTTSQVSMPSIEDGDEEENVVVYLGDDQPVIINRKRSNSINKLNKGKKGNNIGNLTCVNQPPKQQISEQEQQSQPGIENRGGPPKRGQKSKMKKLKKYRDQDEEERQMRMQLLQSAGTSKDKKKSKTGKKGGREKGKAPVQKFGPKPSTASQPSTGSQGHSMLPDHLNDGEKPTKKEENHEDEEEAAQIADDLNIINALTAVPVAEDELLYAVPTCAPYAAMSNFK
ncbi:uncharacterized protein Clbn [Panulirus ornatus]|uniref:uncharacterized protein Clbn n=1 Tax=Panulirus ornatus TaxID=150431 RepID=UPI003A871E4B